MNWGTIFTQAHRSSRRHLRRTLISSVAVAFGVAFTLLFLGFADGVYNQLINDAARLQAGHLTIQRSKYLDEPALDLHVANARELAGKLSEARNRVEALDEGKPPPKPAWAPQRGPQIRENDTPGAAKTFTGATPEFGAYLQIRYGTGEHELQQQRAFLPELPPEQAELMRDSSGAGYSPYPEG